MAETVRLSQSGDEAQLKALWKAAFGDEDALIDLFFHFYQEPEAAVVLDLDGTVVSMAHMLPMGKLVLQEGEKLACCAVYALATLPEYRGRGYAAQVTKAAVTHCAGAGYQANVICPSGETLFEYYRQVGYADFFYAAEAVFRAGELPVSGSKWGIDIISQPEYSWERERFLKERVHIEMDDRAVSYQKRLCRETGGDLFALHFGGEYAAVAAAERLGDESVVVKELLFDGDDLQTAGRAADAAALLASVLPAEQYILRMPVSWQKQAPGKARRFAMMMPPAGRPELIEQSGRSAWYGFAFD